MKSPNPALGPAPSPAKHHYFCFLQKYTQHNFLIQTSPIRALIITRDLRHIPTNSFHLTTDKIQNHDHDCQAERRRCFAGKGQRRYRQSRQPALLWPLERKLGKLPPLRNEQGEAPVVHEHRCQDPFVWRKIPQVH